MKNYDDVIRQLHADCKGQDMTTRLSLVGNAQAMLAWMRVQELERENAALKARLAEMEST